MELHFEVMSDAQRKLLESLGRVLSSTDFYLAGGTAVALRLGHRRSLDLDWFCRSPMGDALEFASWLRRQGVAVETRSFARGTLHAKSDDVLVSFLEYDFPLLTDPDVLPGGGRLASLDDLVCMKLAAAAQRGSRKDFLDLYAIGQQHMSLSDMLVRYRRKYGISDIAHVLYSLVYFDDARDEPMPDMLGETDWDAVKETLRTWVADVAG